MTTNTLPDDRLNHPRTRGALRNVTRLVACYLGLSVATMVAVVLLRNDTTLVTDAVWVRGTIVVASALVMLLFAVRTARGGAAAYRRVRWLSGVMVVAIAVIISLPGLFPTWMRIEQGVCGLILLGVVVILNGRHLRAEFAGASARG